MMAQSDRVGASEDPIAQISGIPVRSLMAVILCMASIPVFGPVMPVGWLAIMTAFLVVEIIARGRPASGLIYGAQWLTTVGYASAAFFLYEKGGAAQTLSVSICGLVIVQVLVSNYNKAGRLWFGIFPFFLSIGAILVSESTRLLSLQEVPGIFTLVAGPILVIVVFRTVQISLVQSRLREAEVLAVAQENANAAIEAHRLSLMAEEVSGMGHWRLDGGTFELKMSDGGYRIHGLEKRDTPLNLSDIFGLCDPVDQQRIWEQVTHAIKSGTGSAFETKIRRADGVFRHVSVRFVVEPSPQGEAMTLLGMVMDVTDVHDRQAALLESEARFRLLADHTTDIVVWTAPDARILYASPSVRRLGYSPDDLTGRMSLDFVHPDDRAGSTELLRNVFADAQSDGALRGSSDSAPRMADGSGWKGIRRPFAIRRGDRFRQSPIFAMSPCGGNLRKT